MNKLIAAKIGAIKAALDAFAPIMQKQQFSPTEQSEAIRETIEELTDYLHKTQIETITAVPDNCTAAAVNLLVLAQYQHAPKDVLFTVNELLGIALETLQKLYMLAAFSIQGEA